jgi:hypothetical protein
MNLLRNTAVMIIITFLSGCHGKNLPLDQKTSISAEFRKMAWLEGIWSNPDDSIRLFTQWQKENDSLLSCKSWRFIGKDSVPTDIQEISKSNDEILLTVKIIEKNESNPDNYKLVTNKNGEHVFENMEKEFPQRIIYILKPDGSLYFRKEGNSGGQSRFEEKILTKMK